MALNDPITVAANAPTPALSLSEVRRDGYGSERWDIANGYQLVFNHSTSAGSGERHYMKMTQTLDATSPYTGQISKQNAVVSISASFPAFGWDPADKAALVQALVDALLDSDVTIPKFVGFQS
jgi:hypothetical protein